MKWFLKPRNLVLKHGPDIYMGQKFRDKSLNLIFNCMGSKAWEVIKLAHEQSL